jgi:hypothetical protein
VAAASFDSGLAVVTGTSAEAVRINRALRIGKARAFVALGRYAEAAALVTDIPTEYAYEHTFSASSGDNAIWGQAADARRYNVGNNVEGNARDIPVANNLDFFSANDPRVPAGYEVTVTSGGRQDTTRSQDGNTLSRTTTLFEQETPAAVFNGTDARLIEAEAAYRANDFPEMMRILNDLRADPPRNGEVQPDPMPALTDPGTADGRIDLLFREKAFWTFGRGQRLGDMRRLIRDYGRTAANTFPTGAHYRGGNYGSAVKMPVPQEEENNQRFERNACDMTRA